MLLNLVNSIMSLFRFPEKIPIFIYLIFFFLLLVALAIILPLTSAQDINFIISLDEKVNWGFSQITDVHFLILKSFYLISKETILNQFQLLRLINFFYLSLIIFVSYKILKLKFYDLDVWNSIGAFLISGGIIFSVLTIQDYLLSGLLNLLILYFLLKSFEENKITNIILTNIFTIVALLMNNFYSLLIITILSFILLINFKLEKERRLAIVSNISFLYITAITIIIINQLSQSQNIFNILYSPKLILERILYLIITLLPLAAVLFISLFFNLFKKLNWNKDLLFFLFMIIVSMIIFIFSPTINFSIIVFVLPLMSIYIFRTLEFVQMKWTKIIYLSLFFIPFLIIYADTSIYESIDNIPFTNYLFYVAIVLLSLFNPIFSIQAQSILNVHKMALFSFTMMICTTLVLFYSQYNNKLLQNVLTQTVNEDFNCSLEQSHFKMIENSSPIMRLYFHNNIKTNNENICYFQLTFNPLTELPINDINSVNKTILDLSEKKFININFKKL